MKLFFILMNINLRKRYLTQAVFLLSLICFSQAIHLSQGHLDTDQAQLSSQDGISSTVDHLNSDSLASSTQHRSFFTLSGNTENTSVGSTDSQSNQQRISSSSVSQQQNSKVAQSDSNDQDASGSPKGSSNAQTSSTRDSEKLTQKNGANSLSSASKQSSEVPQKPSSSTIRKVEKGKYVGKRAKTGEEFPIQIIGEDDTSFFPKTPKQFQADEEEYDVIIVGGGLSAMVGALYLTDNQKKVLMLEKQNYFGGLAAYKKDKKGITYDRGASYWTKAYNEQFQIINHIGVSEYYTEWIIPEPIDTFLWNTTLYGAYPHDGLWDDRTLGLQVPAKYPNGSYLPVLPSSFAIFKLQCLNDNDIGRIPDQPFQILANMELDTMNTNQWLRAMPERFHKRSMASGLHAKERRLWARFQKQIQEGILNKDDPMIDVINFLNLYCRSALGSVNEDVSAMAYANFYSSELQPRFTSPYGTGITINTMIEKLKTKSQYAKLKTESTVNNIKNTEEGVEVRYVEKGVGKIVKAKMALYGAQLGFAPHLVEGLDEKSPEQAKTMRNLQMAHYSVHTVSVSTHPYRQCYDTWVQAKDYSSNDFTDMILGRWVELKGYKKNPEDQQRRLLWDYSITPDDKGSIISLYHSLGTINTSAVNKETSAYNDQYTAERAEFAFNRFEQIFGDAGLLRQEFKINELVTNRWPYSIHVPEPGHYTVKTRIMGQTFQNVVFGNNNLGTPSFEEALFRGHCAANRILYRLNPDSFEQESWSRCEYKA